MNFEGLEQFRMENTKAVMEAMKDIACDPKANIEDRLKAAKIVDGMSDSLIKAYLMSEVTGVEEKTRSKLTNELGKLNRNHNHGNDLSED